MRAYIRINDENIVASPVHLALWRESQKPQGAMITYNDDIRKLPFPCSLYPKETRCRIVFLRSNSDCELISQAIFSYYLVVSELISIFADYETIQMAIIPIMPMRPVPNGGVQW